MRPITFACRETLSLTPEEIAEQMLDVSQWLGFQGYGPIPGIQSAVFELRTPEIVGSRIRVTNRDGSSHVEDILEWQPSSRLQLHMHEFTPPLSRLATGFLETWEFQQTGSQTQVTRTFEMHPKSLAAKPVLWGLSFLLKRAISRHLREMKRQM